MSSKATTTISLTVPEDRLGCTSWIVRQTPEVVAAVLEMSQGMYAFSKSAGGDAAQMDYARLLQEEKVCHTKRETELKAKIKECQTANEILLESHKTQMHSTLSRLETSHKEKLQEAVDFAIKEETTKCRDQIASLLSDAQAKSSELDLLQRNVAEDRAKIAADYDAKLREHMATLRHEKDQRYAEVVEMYKERMKDFLNRQIQLESLVKSKDDTIHEMKDATKAEWAEEKQEIKRMMQRLTGAAGPAKVGRVGENFVFQIHAGMQLGTLTDESHTKQTGYADATWDLETVGLKALVEVKNGCTDDNHIHTTKDIGKFETDVKTAVSQDRINACIIFFLEKRLPNKPQIAVDMSLGVPTIWASRDADDTMPASTLVEIGFRTMVEIFSIVQLQGSKSDVIVKDVANHIEEQLKIHDALRSDVDWMQKSIAGQIKRLNTTSDTIRKLFDNIGALRNRHPLLMCSTDTVTVDTTTWWETEEGVELLDKWRDFYVNRQKGRHPQKPEQLHLSKKLMEMLEADVSLFKKARERILSECRQEGIKKRRVNGAVKVQQAEKTAEKTGGKTSKRESQQEQDSGKKKRPCETHRKEG